MGIVSFLFGSCSKPQPPQPPTTPPPEITLDSEEDGFHDLIFAIRKDERLPDGSQALHAFGVHQGREVGLVIALVSEWQKGSLGPGLPLVTYRGTVIYRSLGAQSDALLQILDQLYFTIVWVCRTQSHGNLLPRNWRKLSRASRRNGLSQKGAGYLVQ